MLVAFGKPDQNLAPVDPWTVVHFSAGLASGLVDMPLWQLLAVSVGYEIAERSFQKEAPVRKFFRVSQPESAANAAVDVGVAVVGWYLGRRYNSSL